MRSAPCSARIGTASVRGAIAVCMLTLLAACRGCEESRPTPGAAVPFAVVAPPATKPDASSLGEELPGAAVIIEAVRRLSRIYDVQNGGFGIGPKVPEPSQYGLLARYARRTHDAVAVRMLGDTLRHIALGKIHDQNRGFHEYADDAAWDKPQGDEKLALNAQLVLAYLEAYQVTGFDGFTRVARGTLGFISHDLARPDGGFYSTPAHDEKLITTANALAISAFARAGFVLGEADYTTRAREAVEFWLGAARRNDGRIQASFERGWAKDPGHLVDQALMVQALLDLAEATAEPGFLREALELQAMQDSQFYDPVKGGYFDVGSGPEATGREKTVADSDVPSGNAVTVANLLRIATLTGRADTRFHAEQSLRIFGPQLSRPGSTMPRMLSALCDALDAGRVIVVVRPDEESGDDFVAIARTAYVPADAMLMLREPIAAEWLALVPALAQKHVAGGGTVAYVCQERECTAPIREAGAFADALRVTEPLPHELPPALVLPVADPPR
jgi:uncharacterized protein YyaL (SSP411 family)